MYLGRFIKNETSQDNSLISSAPNDFIVVGNEPPGIVRVASTIVSKIKTMKFKPLVVVKTKTETKVVEKIVEKIVEKPVMVEKIVEVEKVIEVPVAQDSTFFPDEVPADWTSEAVVITVEEKAKEHSR